VWCVWSGTVWEEIQQNSPHLGIGTKTDAINPFAAKLNEALWSALFAGDGGDGDLRYTLNKEASGNVLSLLMQSVWSDCAEIGFVGDDDVHVRENRLRHSEVKRPGQAVEGELIIRHQVCARQFFC
jgi:hypothetical protein